MSKSEMYPGCIILPNDKIDTWTPLLRSIYEFESNRISGPGSYRRDINDVLWSIQDFQKSVHPEEEDTLEMLELMKFLTRKRQLMEVPSNKGAQNRYITRVGETVRLLGHTYEYWYRGRPGVDAVRWLIEKKKVPRLEVSAKEFLENVSSSISEEFDEGAEPPNLQSAIETVVKGVSLALSPQNWEEASFSKFQLDATKEMLLSQTCRWHKPKTQILTAGVGSGKTIGFSMATLISAVEGVFGGEGARRCHLLIYPRKALAQDQYNSLKRYVDSINVPELIIHLEHSSQYKALGYKSVKEGIHRVWGGLGPAPDIIITTFETLKRRLQHPLVVKKLAKHLKRVVLDEVHLAEGLSGAHIASLMSRLEQVARERLLWTASSATVARPDDHATRLFGLGDEGVRIVQPEEDDLRTVGLAHHVFLRPNGIISNLGVMVNTASLLVHTRRDDVGQRREMDRRREKTLAFADNLDILGRWNADLKENERTENSRDRRHPSNTNRDDWKERQREIPYALRFHKPLQKRIATVGGDDSESGYLPVLQEHKDLKICTKCMEGKRLSLGVADSEVMRSLSKIPYRNPHLRNDKNVKAIHVHNKVFRESGKEIGSMDLCPYLRAGACMWFPRGDDESIEWIGGTSSPKRYEWKNVARSTIHSAKRDTSADDLEDDFADVVFQEYTNRVYDVGPSSLKLPVDIVFASPSLEVGVDLPMLTESIMTKAIRNVASYRQKAGRIGRENGLDVVNVTLVTDSPIDLHYYRQPRKLVSRGRLDPIRMKDRNEAVILCSIYTAIWDWLALNSNLPESIPTKILPDGRTEFAERLQLCVNTLESARDDLGGYLERVSRGRYTSKDSAVKDAIDQAHSELAVLLRDASGTLESQPRNERMRIADAFIYELAGIRGRSISLIHGDKIERLMEGSREYQEKRSNVRPDQFGLDDVFRRLDLMQRSGVWDLEELSEVSRELDGWIAENEEEEGIRDLKRIAGWTIPDMIEELESLKSGGCDPFVWAVFDQYKKLMGPQPWKAHYLSYVMQSVPAFEWVRKESWFVRPENLFSNPYEPSVTLSGEAPKHAKNVSIKEAMFAFVPGTWTYRLPEGCFKAKVGNLKAEPGGSLVATLDLMTRSGSRFDLVRKGLPIEHLGPSVRVDVYRPTTVSLKKVKGKYLPLDRGRGLVLDWDEARHKDQVEEEDYPGKSPLVKIPRSYLNRGVDINPLESEDIWTMIPDVGSLVLEQENGAFVDAEALPHIRHPMFSKLLESAEWHGRLEATEYVYSSSRSYSRSGGEGVEVIFWDRFGRIAMGTTFETEGMSISLKPETTKKVIEDIRRRMEEGRKEWSPSAIKAYKAFMSQVPMEGGSSLSPFIADDICSVILDIVMDGDKAITFSGLVSELKTLSEDEERFEGLAKDFYLKKLSVSGSEIEDFGGEEIEATHRDASDRATNLVSTARVLVESMGPHDDFLNDWVRHTLANTFGIVALTALQEYSGATNSDIGYATDYESWKNDIFRIFLYDRAPFGNGSAAVARRFLHIPNVCRHGDTQASRLLPSQDFLSTLEERLLQCPQFHTDMSALSMHTDGGEPAPLKGIQDVAEQAREVFRVSYRVWREIGVSGPQDAWKLPIANARRKSLAHLHGIDVDDIARATTSCWNGCPECVDRPEVVNGGLWGRNYIDKAVLDHWVASGMGKTDEYVALDLEELVDGNALISFGTPHRLRLDLPARRLRSISLPWTIGFEIDRHSEQPLPRMVIRTSDVTNLDLTEKKAPGIATAIESVGFKRLLWFDLITTAYLDVLGLLEEERKELKLVYYDCRDVVFDDVGFSPRMIEAILSEMRESGLSQGLSSLSDILSWLLARGFKVSLCVDEARSKEDGVRKFLKRLKRIGGDSAHIVTKKIKMGSMHKKALVTSVAVLKGSANLTETAAERNEEIIDHFFYGTAGYDQLNTNVADTFHGAKEWKL